MDQALRILEAVQRLGSLQAAAKELGMEYKALWTRNVFKFRRIDGLEVESWF